MIQQETNKIQGREKPFRLMSRKPGIGFNYIESGMKKWHQQNEAFYMPRGNYKHRMPRYYKDKIFTQLQKDINTEEQIKHNDYQKLREWKRLSVKENPHIHEYLLIEQKRRKIQASAKRNNKL